MDSPAQARRIARLIALRGWSLDLQRQPFNSSGGLVLMVVRPLQRPISLGFRIRLNLDFALLLNCAKASQLSRQKYKAPLGTSELRR
jgi:hypothetical protein